MLATLTAIAGLIGLVITIGLLAWQTRAAAKQAEIANATAGATVLYTCAASLRDVLSPFVDRPELRGYFYDSVPLPDDRLERSRVLTIAEMFGDILEDGLVTHRLIPSSESEQDWIGYCRYLRAHSPALDTMIDQHGAWWPELSKFTTRASQMPS
jgi:hypothetical protein